MDKSARFLLLGVVGIFAVGIIFLTLFHEQKNTLSVATPTAYYIAPPEIIPKSTTTPIRYDSDGTVISASRSPITIQAPRLPYGDAVKKYGGFRFQFSAGCTRVSPNTFVAKKGLRFMIDNRDDITHQFTVANQTVIIGPYNYGLIMATPAGKFSVSCDGVQRATITIAP